jgi:hypothetical protein
LNDLCGLIDNAHLSSIQGRNSDRCGRLSRTDKPIPPTKRSTPLEIKHPKSSLMTEVETIIAEAAKLPLRDAAFSLWRQRPRLDALEGPPMTPEDIRIARALSLEEVSAKVRFSHDHAQDGATFDRLKRAHPEASDTEIRLAIIAAVRFDDACFKYFTVDSTDYWQRVVRAVALAQRHENPGYLEGTYEDARYHVAYYMK